MIVSGFKIRTYSTLLARIPALFPRAKPRFCWFSTTRTCGYRLRTNSIESSTEPLSETMTSKSVECVPSWMERKQSRRTRRSFQQIMTIESFIDDFRQVTINRLDLYDLSPELEGFVRGLQHADDAQAGLA